jgi:hypothetical protein
MLGFFPSSITLLRVLACCIVVAITAEQLLEFRNNTDFDSDEIKVRSRASEYKDVQVRKDMDFNGWVRIMTYISPKL